MRGAKPRGTWLWDDGGGFDVANRWHLLGDLGRYISERGAKGKVGLFRINWIVI
jgi:hypothetical protein